VGDKENERNHQQEVNQAAHNMKNQEGSDPNEKQNERENQEEVSHETTVTDPDGPRSIRESL